VNETKVGRIVGVAELGSACSVKNAPRRPSPICFMLRFAMIPDDFRRLALSQRQAVEVCRWGQWHFCVLRRSFASLAGPADSVATVQLTSEQQAVFVDAAPRIFAPAPATWDGVHATGVVLAYAYEAIVESALVAAWSNIAREPHRDRASVTPARWARRVGTIF
jgi:hypothetical protein